MSPVSLPTNAQGVVMSGATFNRPQKGSRLYSLKDRIECDDSVRRALGRAAER
jgi:hypothetical protein